MLSKTKTALVAVLMLGIASAAQAGSRDDPDASGGYRVGPMGQSFDGVNPAVHRPTRADFFGQAENLYGYVAIPHQLPRKKAKSR